MASQPSISGNRATLGADLLAIARDDGSRGHVWRRDHALLGGADASRNLADVVHHMAQLHGRRPGLVDIAVPGAVLAPMHDAIVRGFAYERRYLAQLVVAVGPLPGTPGQALAHAAIVGQRHALETLARSDRTGCSCGAVAALVMDWPAIRPVLDAAAVRFGVLPLPCTLPDPATLAATIDAVAAPPVAARAIGFGGRQLLLQHRGLWDLLETRAGARQGG